MAKATNRSDRSHARTYAHWRTFPAWTSLSLAARCLLVEILLEYRPGKNGQLAWPCRKAARAIGVSKDTGARALTELELKGWLTVERCANFGRSTVPACYALAMYANDATGDPASLAFGHWKPDSPLSQTLPRVAPQGRDGITTGTRASHHGDTGTDFASPIATSDALTLSRLYKGLA